MTVLRDCFYCVCRITKRSRNKYRGHSPSGTDRPGTPDAEPATGRFFFRYTPDPTGRTSPPLFCHPESRHRTDPSSDTACRRPRPQRRQRPFWTPEDETRGKNISIKNCLKKKNGSYRHYRFFKRLFENNPLIKKKSFWVPLFDRKRRRFLKLFGKSFTKNLYNFRILLNITFSKNIGYFYVF